MFLAKVFGFYFVIVTLAFFVNPKMYQKLIHDYIKMPTLFGVFGGTLDVILGLMVVLTHNIWVADWPVVITLIGWLMLVKGVFVLFLPDAVMKFVKKFDNPALRNADLLSGLIIGILLLMSVYFF